VSATNFIVNITHLVPTTDVANAVYPIVGNENKQMHTLEAKN